MVLIGPRSHETAASYDVDMENSFGAFLNQQLKSITAWLVAVIDNIGRGQIVGAILALVGGALVVGYWTALVALVRPHSEALFWSGAALFIVVAIEVGAFQAWKARGTALGEAQREVDTLRTTLRDLEDRRPKGELRASSSEEGVIVFENPTDADIYWADWEVVNDAEFLPIKGFRSLVGNHDPLPLDVMKAHTRQVLHYATFDGLRRPIIRTRWKDQKDSGEWCQEDWPLSW